MSSAASQRAIGIQLILVARLIFVGCIELPCHYYDSINITNGIWHQNNSVSFDNTEFPHDQYAEVNYTLDGAKKDTDPHFRGCLCNIKPCLRLCCSNKQYDKGTVVLDDECNEALIQLEGDIRNESYKYISLILDHRVVYFSNHTCKQFYFAGPDETKKVRFYLSDMLLDYDIILILIAV